MKRYGYLIGLGIFCVVFFAACFGVLVKQDQHSRQMDECLDRYLPETPGGSPSPEAVRSWCEGRVR